MWKKYRDFVNKYYIWILVAFFVLSLGFALEKKYIFQTGTEVFHATFEENIKYYFEVQPEIAHLLLFRNSLYILGLILPSVVFLISVGIFSTKTRKPNFLLFLYPLIALFCRFGILCTESVLNFIYFNKNDFLTFLVSAFKIQFFYAFYCLLIIFLLSLLCYIFYRVSVSKTKSEPAAFAEPPFTPALLRQKIDAFKKKRQSRKELTNRVQELERQVKELNGQDETKEITSDNEKGSD